MADTTKDMIIIGAGPAGLTAAIYALRAGKSVLVFDKAVYGGQTVNTPEIENYPAIAKISGTDFATQLYEQVQQLGAEFVFGDVTPVMLDGPEKKLLCGGTEYSARTVVIANGAVRRKLGCEGEERLTGRGVSYCATCDGAFFRDGDVIVAGSGNTAVEDALYLSNICKNVTMLIRKDIIKGEHTAAQRLKEKANVKIYYNQSITKILGESKVEEVETTDRNTGELRRYKTGAVFVAVGLSPDNRAFGEMIELDEYGYIKAGEDCKTNLEGVFAAGDTRTKKLRQIITAAADGAVAAVSAAEYIDKMEF